MMQQTINTPGRGCTLGWIGLWTAFLLTAIFAPAAFAQVVTGSLSGTVQDQTNAAIPGATVILQNQTSSDTRKTQSNGSGYFTFAGVIPGAYSVTIDAKGFKSWKQTDILLNVGDSRAVTDIKLAVGTASETMVVQSASMEMVPTENGEHSALLSTQDIARISVQSREISELLKILPGMTSVPNGVSNGTGTSFTTMGATGSEIGNGLSPNGAPYRGGTAYILDGANIIDVGANANSIAAVNPDMTAEVKVQTSNFGADSEDGPVIVNVISKSGGSNYHGQAYMYSRNGVLNSNTWQNNHAGTKRTQDQYYYPGGNVGGPVRIPHSDFNKNNKLLFWAGYEYQWQNPGSSTVIETDVPGADMKKGNFSLKNTNDTSAFDSNAKLCPTGFASTYTNWCNSLLDANGNPNSYDSKGQLITNPSAIPVDSQAIALMSLYPSANIDPTKENGYNYYQAVGSQQNVYIYRFRVDYNLNDNNKFFVTYQQGHDDLNKPINIWWNPSLAAPYPGGGMDESQLSRVLTANLLTVVTPTLTNEFVAAWAYLNAPFKAHNVSANYSSTVGYTYGTPYNNSLSVPVFNNIWSQDIAPNDYMTDAWGGGTGSSYTLQKANFTVADNITKVYKTHTFKFGLFTQLANNDQSNQNDLNGVFYTTSKKAQDPLNNNLYIGATNPTANMVMGIAGHFDQTNSEPPDNVAFRTTAAYMMDDWKVFPRLMVNLGWRFDHIGRWYDRTGNGLAVWLPGLYASDVANNTSWPFPGVRWHGVDPGIPNSGYPTRFAFTEPRLGLAYDLFGTGKTVLRGGWGEYRWSDQPTTAPVDTAANVQTYNAPSGNVTMKEIGALYGTSFSAASGSVNTADPNDFENSSTTAYNFTISQQMPWHTLLEVAYVGNSTKHLLMGGESGASQIGGSNGYTNQNKIPLGGLFKKNPVTGAAAPSDPENTGSYAYTDYFPYYAGYGQNSVQMENHSGYSNYNSFQVAWAKQTGKLSFNLNYTWSKALGIVGVALDPFTVHGNYAVLNIDRPQVINTSYSYAFGRVLTTSNKILNGAVNGWNISGTTTWQAGGSLQTAEGMNFGMTITDTALNNESLSSLTYYGTNLGTVLPTNSCNPKAGLKSHQVINALCLVPPTIGSYGKRAIGGYISGPAYFNSDLTIYKEFHIHGKQAAEFRASWFNWLNHPLYSFNSTTQMTPTFTTTDKVNFTSTLLSNVPSGDTQGTPDQKTGYRLGELSVKYHF
jgi:hypothetical protein